MEITLPNAFETRLALNKPLRAAVDRTLSDFSVWFSESKLPFFTDYTDHGLKHLQDVIQTINGLVPASAMDSLSPGDVAILVIATLLHDSALHLSEQGFKELIHGNASAQFVQGLDNEPWNQLWEAYLFTARRWDDGKRRNVFGDVAFDADSYSVGDPFEHYTNLQETDRKFIGEFIRLHHSRMAHEFALFGIPGPVGVSPISIGLPSDLSDIAGLVARSHGMGMRPCIDYLTAKGYDKRTYKEVHAPYLMCLIRVADYLQIAADRAPHSAFRYRHIPSPQSRLEWEVHNSIQNIHTAGDDPESIHVQASPKSVQAFLRLKDWLSGIQAELDASWAVLGEVYGRVPPLDRLGLNLRRVRSNLDDLATFKSAVEYVPTRVELDVARAELLKLLIGPLYGGDKPQMGVRELIQNAVDAVRERASLKGGNVDKSLHDDIPDADVLVTIGKLNEDQTAWLTVQDRGIGMSEDVIRNYFLRAGASFRQSEVWQKVFEEGSKPGTGSKVVRSGRFGVGALAAFLLGDEIHVETRHVNAVEGFRFSVRITQEPISLIRDTTLSVGTKIRIKVDRECHERLSRTSATTKLPAWLGWHLYSWPKVVRLFERKADSEYHCGWVEASKDGHPTHWLKLPFDADYNVFWSYQTGVPALSCNGIWVTNSQSWQKFKSLEFEHPRYSLSFPKIAIHDPNAKLPMTLTRDSVALEAYPFESELAESIIIDWLAYLIAKTPTSRPFDPRELPIFYPAWSPSNHQVINGKNGVFPFDPRLMAANKPKSVVYFGRRKLLNQMSVAHDVIAFPKSGLDNDRHFLAELLAEDVSNSFLQLAEKTLGVRVLMRNKEAKEWSKPQGGDDEPVSYYRNSKQWIARAREVVQQRFSGFESTSVKSGWIQMQTGNCPDSLLEIESFTDLRSPAVLFIEQFIEPSEAKGLSATLISTLWDKIIQHPFIPYDIEQRRSLLANAYQLLAERIAYYENQPIKIINYAETAWGDHTVNDEDNDEDTDG